MGKTRKERCKEEFLSNVTSVDVGDILASIRGFENEDVYTHFVTEGSINSGTLSKEELNEFFLSIYSDWYFLHKNTFNVNLRAVKLLTEFAYAPIKISEGQSLYNIVSSNEYADILPLSLQYINKLEDKFFVSVKTETLHNQFYPTCDYSVRLYLNIRADHLLEFAELFLSRAYFAEFPAILKILNGDYRNDTITIYTDYEYVFKVIETIDDIKFEHKYLFEGMGNLSSLLGMVNDYIGFGEVEKKENAYIFHRTNALLATEKLAEVEYLRKALMLNEEKVITRTNGKTYTPTEYLEYLVEKNAVALLESRLIELEKLNPKPKEKIKSIRDMLGNVWEYIDIREEVNKLKRSFTRNENYVLEIKGVGKHEFDYISKLFSLFGGSVGRGLKPITLNQKKDAVSSQFFKTTEGFEGVNTKEFLEIYFRTKLSYILQDIIVEETENLYRSKSSTTLTRLKKKVIEKLKQVLNWVVDEDDEGKEYIDRYIYDLLRILSTDGLEMVETHIAGKSVPMDTFVPSEMVSLLPFMKSDIRLLSENTNFINNILLGFGVNADNLCLTSSTENVCKKKTDVEKQTKKYNKKPTEELSMSAV